MNIASITHPLYNVSDWQKWRLTYAGGQDFINAYLRQYSRRETETDFQDRKAITYCPAFAKVGINEVRDSIYNRMADITRLGGTKSYQEAISGQNGGVDLFGSSMNYFMGCQILPELLTMQKVGIYVDMPPLQGESLVDNQNLRPYIYMFPVEDIRCWVLDESAETEEFASILLQEEIFVYDKETGFPVGKQIRYRRLWKDSAGQVMAAFYNTENEMMDQYGNGISTAIPLSINKIPFIVLDIGESLLSDVADYQIALLNLASTDMSYAVRSNFPLYVEQFDPKSNPKNLKPAGSDSTETSAKVEEVNVGASKGRRYPMGMNAPAFIHPSPEPLSASMEKQEQLKREIRQLLKLAITNLAPPAMASAESKKVDSRTLESGLGFIGLTLENAERKIAEYWSMYEGSTEQTTVNYPQDYSLYSEADRQEEADKLEEMKDTVVSPTYNKAIQKRLVRLTMGTKISLGDIQKIEKEIDEGKTLVSDPDLLLQTVEAGLCDNELASELLGFPAGTVQKAEKDHANRLARIAISQAEGAAAARGNPDASSKPSGKAEKIQSRDTTQDDRVSKKQRGKGK